VIDPGGNEVLQVHHLGEYDKKNPEEESPWEYVKENILKKVPRNSLTSVGGGR
jgi:hypothetical protein